ncbi:MAG: hypothetical protein ISR58_20505, partial [Anaerolineales bacterium]|nr:hypothetical protein [Anaerolineales bacterium]
SDTSDDLSIISAQDASGYTTGCVKPNLNGVYVYTRRELPGDYIVFRITAFDAEGITLEYIVGIYDSEDQQSTSEEGTSPDEPSEPSPSDQPLTETPLHFPAMHGFFDFDNGTSLQYAGGIVDLSLWPNEDQQLQMELNLFTEGIEPLFGIWGETEPSYIDCSTASLSTDPIPLTGGDLSLGTYICLQTSEGLFGYLRMENLLIDPEFGEQALDLAYAMWDSTGSERILPPSLHTYGNANVSDGSGKDLDFFKNSQVEDLSFQIVAEEIEVTPLSGTTLALWGTTFPSKENCESLSLGSEPIKIQKNNLQEIIDEVSYFCYQTDQGRLGRIQVNGAEEDPNTLSVFYYTDVPQVSFAYDTWE